MLLLTLCSITALAEQQGNLPVDYFQKATFGKELRMVNDGLCTDLPDDAGTAEWYGYEVFCTGKTGVTTSLKGCVVHWRYSDRSLFKEDIIEPGEKAIAPDDAAYWERYNCYTQTEYTCEDYESEGCGESGKYADCDSDEMLRVRTCSGNVPDSVETERCIGWYECFEENCNVQYSDWSSCNEGTQYRTVTEADCSEYKDYQDCSVNCKSPSGSPGDTICDDNGYIYECKWTGNWQQTSQACDPQIDCQNPSAADDSILCIDGFQKECKDGSWSKTGEYCTVSEDIEETSTAAFYDPTSNSIIARVGLQNTGDDMKDTYILEIQVRPEGSLPLAFIGDQEACDSSHPENVHKQFMLSSGESEVIEFIIPESTVGEGTFDVYALTRHKCYADLTDEQKENHDEYNRVSPYPSAKKLGEIQIGDSDETSSSFNYRLIIGWVLIISGIVATLYGLLMIGIPAFVIGLIMVIWPYITSLI